jgi:hypothetical protein
VNRVVLLEHFSSEEQALALEWDKYGTCHSVVIHFVDLLDVHGKSCRTSDCPNKYS